ncbi:hypothetical protein PG985_011996 [Apiospora marii]|uniref:Uncharacterized protein n=1 Tax=Apiospora marii TaxID=335849 RepID=A0ABR1REM6_9PEZI
MLLASTTIYINEVRAATGPFRSRFASAGFARLLPTGYKINALASSSPTSCSLPPPSCLTGLQRPEMEVLEVGQIRTPEDSKRFIETAYIMPPEMPRVPNVTHWLSSPSPKYLEFQSVHDDPAACDAAL